MVTLEQTLRESHDWAVNRIHTLCDKNEDFDCDNAYAIQQEFNEWLDSSIIDHEIFSLEYIGD